MYVIKNKKIYLGISLFLMVASIIVISIFGLRFGIDFTGGSILEITYDERIPTVEMLDESVSNLDIGSFSLRPAGDSSYIVRTRFLEENERPLVLQALSLEGEYPLHEDRFNSVGPTIGDELRRKSYMAMSIVILTIIIFIAFAFRKVSEPVSSWKYGLVAVVALLHDVLIPTGVFALLGVYGGAEVDVLFVMALLAILGYSVNDTIVVFDRVRENLRLNQDTHTKESFSDTVGHSLGQTYARSFNTSFTTFLVLLSLYLFGGTSTTYFALTLMIGVLAGTYSSIFLASPLLVLISKK